MENDDKLLISKTDDLFRLCDKYCEPRFSDFLDGGELAVIHDNATIPFGYNVAYYGGFSDAEKMIMGVFPEWCEPDYAQFPISCVKVMGGFTRKLTHRDYLGTVMGLGIVPQKLGDIVVYDDFAYVLLHTDIAEFVCDNLHKIGNQGVKTEVISDLSVIKIERRYKTIGAVCASARLDAVVGAAVNSSRSQASALINGGKVKLNHRITDKCADTVSVGDLISVRGYGRYIVSSFDGKTRKDRQHITFKQYI